MNGKLHPSWITDEHGNRVSVVLPVEEYEALLEGLADLAAVAERRDEPTVTHEELVRRLRSADRL